jgi:hypothetical protein
VWNDAFGAVRRAARQTPTPRLSGTAAALGLRLLERGQQGEWEIALDAPARLRWDDLLLPEASWIRATRSHETATILYERRGGRRRLCLRRGKHGWSTASRQALSTLERHGGRYVLLHRSAVDSLSLDGVPTVSAQGIAVARRELRRALDLLAQCAAIYLPWVARVLRTLIPVASSGRGTMIYSGSDQDWPGAAYFSIRCPTVAIAEMLIHEATHQYFYLLARYGALDDRSGRMFYSPIKKTSRPIGMILLAYHAFGNVLLFYRLCRHAGLADAGYCEQHEAALAPQVRQLQDTLAGARAPRCGSRSRRGSAETWPATSTTSSSSWLRCAISTAATATSTTTRTRVICSGRASSAMRRTTVRSMRSAATASGAPDTGWASRFMAANRRWSGRGVSMNWRGARSRSWAIA